MDYKEALEIFEWENELDILSIDPKDLRRQYRKLCLKYHPDKNGGDPTSVAAFQRIQNAYMILLDVVEEDLDNDQEDEDQVEEYTKIPTSWDDILPLLPKWLQPIMITIVEYKDSPILTSITKILESRIRQWAETLDKHILRNIHEFIYRISKSGVGGVDFIEKILGEILRKKCEKDKYVILEPNLEDLFACNIIRHVGENDHVYIIPTWIEESVFDVSGSSAELVFQCIPKCPLNVFLDEKRNIHCKVVYSIMDIFSDQPVIIPVLICPGVQVDLAVSNLYLRTYQTVVFRGKGIPNGNVKDVFDVSKLTDIILHVHLS